MLRDYTQRWILGHGSVQSQPDPARCHLGLSRVTVGPRCGAAAVLDGVTMGRQYRPHRRGGDCV